MAKNNVTVSRYVDKQLGWDICVQPEDGSWALFIPAPTEPNLQPQLWHRVGTCVDEHGDTQEAFACEGSPGHLAFLSEYGAGVGLTEAYDQEKIDATRARLEAEYAAEGKK
jgi:hypothetical protein